MSNDLKLLDAVELKIALAESDTQFQTQIQSFLVPIICMLERQDPAVKQKVLSLCQHISKRLKSSSEIKVPLSSLTDAYIDVEGKNTNAAVKTFLLVYLELGFARIGPSVPAEKEEILTLIPKLFKGISKRQSQQQTEIFSILLSFLHVFIEAVNVPSIDVTGKKNGPALGIDDPFGFKKPIDGTVEEEDLGCLLEWFKEILLYAVPASGKKALTALNAREMAALPPPSPLETLPPSLSKASVSFITNKLKVAWLLNHTLVRDIKCTVLRFIGVEGILGKDVALGQKYIISLIATTDSAHEVQFIGDGHLKRFVKPNFEDARFVQALYSLYQGAGTLGGETFRSGAKYLLKQKILDLAFTKSATAANTLPQMIQVVFDALYGPESSIHPRLRQSGMAFVQWLARMSKDEVITPIAPILLSGLLKLIDEDATPTTPAGDVLRGFAYEGVGLLSKRAPSLFENDTGLLIKFFEALSKESKAVLGSLQDCLIALAQAYRSQLKNPVFLEKIQEILVANIDGTEQYARYVAVKYATSLFPFSDAFARYLCLIAASDAKLEVREEAMKGFEFPGNDVMDENDAAIPRLGDMIDTLDKLSSRSRVHVVKVPGVFWIGNMSVDTFTITLIFLHQLLVKSVSPAEKFERISIGSEEKNGWPTIELSSKLKEGLAVMVNGNDKALLGYLKLIEIALSDPQSSGHLKSIASHYLLELVAFSPKALSDTFLTKREWVYEFLTSPKLETKIAMSRVLGIVFTEGVIEDTSRKATFELLFTSLSQRLTSKNYDEKQGAVLGLGYLIGRVAYRYKDPVLLLGADRLKLAIDGICASILATDIQNEMVIASCLAVSEVVRYAKLPASFLEEGGAIKKTIDALETMVKSSKESKIQEAAVLSIGQISVSNTSLIKPLFDFFLTLPNAISKQPELHFNVGESLCASLFGFDSTNMIEYLDISSLMAPLTPRDSGLLEECLKSILALVSPAQSAVTKKAVCIWLLCIAKYAGKNAIVKSYLLKFHTAFNSLLADKDDFTQEIASKGIGLIYDIGDQALKNELVQGLVSTFTDEKKIAAQSVSRDTQLFAGDIGATPDGGNLNTYQSILSLAADMNQPDLVYKFMSLASHHAIWNSRRGASMGFGSIAAQAEKELEPYLPKLVPRLYRYQFDPHPKTAAGMKNIWKSLVKDPVKSIEDFFSEIITDVLKGMGDKQWRTRESCCAALADLLHGRQLEQLQPYMTELWTMSFRTLDDIKESVRKAAFLTCKTLTNLTVRYANPEYFAPSKSQKVMDDMIPFLLDKGLGNMAEEVRQFSLLTILKLCKTGKVLLKPHVANIVCVFLESLSSLEPQSMNYISLNADKYNITKDALDNVRLSAAKTSPIMEALDQCVQYIDQPILADLAPRLCVIIRKGIGLPTRAGTARFLYTLVNRLPREMTEFADPILKALSGAVFDRSAAVRKSFSMAAGYVSKLATVGAVEKLAIHLRNTYLEANDEEGRSIAPVTLLEISRHAPNVASELHCIILPLAFMGARDTTYVALAEVWTRVWEENTGGSTSAIKKWKIEILDSLSSILITSPSWELKKQCGKGFVDFIKALGVDVEAIMPKLLPLLIESLSGRTWDGKEALVEALATLASEGKLYFKKNEKDRTLLEDILIREAKKNSKPYKRVVLDYLGKSFNDMESNRFTDVSEYLYQMAQGIEEEDDDVEENIQKPMMLVIRSNSFKALGLCFPFDFAKQSGALINELGMFLGKNLEAQVWNVRLAILESLATFLGKLKSPPATETTDVIVKGLLICLSDIKYRSVREAAITALKPLITVLGGQANLKSGYLASFTLAVENERDSVLQDTLKNLIVKK